MKSLKAPRWWVWIQNFLDVKGGSIMGAWSILMMVLSIYSVMKTKTIDGGVVSLYAAAVGAFTIHSTGKAIAERGSNVVTSDENNGE